MTLEQALDLQIEREVEDATRILAHYFVSGRELGPCGVTVSSEERQDTTAEMRDVVNAIVGAAILTVQRNRLAHLGKLDEEKKLAAGRFLTDAHYRARLEQTAGEMGVGDEEG